MFYDGEYIKKTDYTCFQYGKTRNVYTTKDGRLFFKYDNHLHGIFKNNCNGVDDEDLQNGV